MNLVHSRNKSPCACSFGRVRTEFGNERGDLRPCSHSQEFEFYSLPNGKPLEDPEQGTHDRI